MLNVGGAVTAPRTEIGHLLLEHVPRLDAFPDENKLIYAQGGRNNLQGTKTPKVIQSDLGHNFKLRWNK